VIPANIMALYEEAACQQPDAISYLVQWHHYCHELDDLVDEPADERSLPLLLNSQARACSLYSAPFFVLHVQFLRPLVLLIASTWGDSVAFEHGPDPGLKTYADSLRLCGNEMVCAVALLCGGYTHLRQISPRLRAAAWAMQHPVLPAADP
jgi:hypothetical protein